MLLVLAAAGALRLAYLAEYASLPFWDGPLFDSLVYLRQAAAVQAGHHGDASLLAMSPLYGYFLALLQGIAPLVAVVQAGLGLATLWLVWRLARRRLPAGPALVAPLALATYGALVFYETKLLSETLGLSLAVAALWLSEEGRARGRTGLTAAAGAVFALAVLSRASLLLLLPFVALAEALEPGRRLRRAAAFTLAAGALLLARGAWTQAETGHFVPVIMASSTAATTTHRAWDGELRASDGSDRRASAWDVVKQAEERLAGREPAATYRGLDLVGLVEHAPAKLARLFSDTETGFDYPYYGERTLLTSLNLLPTSFGTLLVLGALGLAARLRRRDLGSLWPLLAWIVGIVALVVVFHPSTRYRLPIVVPLALLSADAVAFVAALAPRPRALAAGALLAVAAVFTWRLYDYRLANPANLERTLATSHGQAGDHAAAEVHFARARALESAGP